MGELAVRTLRAVLVVVLAGTVLIQAGMVWTLRRPAGATRKPDRSA